MTNAALRGKPYAGNPHVRFDEGEVASAATPRPRPIWKVRPICWGRIMSAKDWKKAFLKAGKTVP